MVWWIGILVAILLILLVFSQTASEYYLEPISPADTYLYATHSPITPTYVSFVLSEDPKIRERQDFVISQCERFGINPSLCLAIIACEGGFFSERIVNKTFGPSGGIGHWQFLQRTYNKTIQRMGDLAPEECRNPEAVFVSHCNLLAGAWLLSMDGTGPWGTPDSDWGSYSCWYRK